MLILQRNYKNLLPKIIYRFGIVFAILLIVDANFLSSIFFDKIQQILLVPIQKRDDEEIVERLMTFLALFSCNVASSNREFFHDFMDSILIYVNVKQKDVRYRSCHLISSILVRLARSDPPFKFEYDSEFNFPVLFVIPLVKMQKPKSLALFPKD